MLNLNNPVIKTEYDRIQTLTGNEQAKAMHALIDAHDDGDRVECYTDPVTGDFIMKGQEQMKVETRKRKRAERLAEYKRTGTI
jgi:hypothetical protein